MWKSLFHGPEIARLAGMPQKVRIVEVGVRDGLQSEKAFVPTPDKIELIKKLVACGLKSIEATSFVRVPKIPQVPPPPDSRL